MTGKMVGELLYLLIVLVQKAVVASLEGDGISAARKCLLSTDTKRSGTKISLCHVRLQIARKDSFSFVTSLTETFVTCSNNKTQAKFRSFTDYLLMLKMLKLQALKC